MTLYLAGSEMGTFIPSDNQAKETADYINTNFSRAAVRATDGASYAESISFGNRTDFWVHGCLASADYPSGTITLLTFVDSSDVEAIKFTYNRATDVMTIQYWNGSAYVTIDTINISIDAFQDVDMHVECNSATASFSMYFAGTKRIDETNLNLSGSTAINRLRVYGANYSARLSQLIVGDEPMIGWRLATYYPSGAGADTDFNGTYAGIDEIVFNDADFVNSATANEVSTFTLTGPALTGYVVKAVAVTARAKRGASGPQNLQLVLRSGGTNYFSSTKSLDVGYGGYCHIWETDPATSAAWQNTAISSIQAGVKSIT